MGVWGIISYTILKMWCLHYREIFSEREEGEEEEGQEEEGEEEEGGGGG